MRIANPKTGEVKRIKRNGPCHCGSGRKFKHCCLPGIYRQAQIEREIMNDQKTEARLSNPFRDNLDKQAEAERDPVEVETEKVGRAEMLRRDMYATMRSLQVTKMVTAMDKDHTETAIRVYNEFIKELIELPVSEAVRDIGAGIAKQVVQLEKVVEGSGLTRASQVILAALEGTLGKSTGAVNLDEADDEKLEAALSDTPEESFGETKESIKVTDDDSLEDEPKDVDEAI